MRLFYTTLATLITALSLLVTCAHHQPEPNRNCAVFATDIVSVATESRVASVEIGDVSWKHKQGRWRGIVGRGFTAAGFKEYVSKLKLTNWHPAFVVLHNTDVPTLARWKQISGKQWMIGLSSYYYGQGWSAGPHLFVADNYIWVFTPLDQPGVHAPSWNNLSWGVEVVGDYSHGKLNPGSRNNLISALATLHQFGHIDTHSLRFHGEDVLTTHKGCPGKNISKAEIIEQVHRLIKKRELQ